MAPPWDDELLKAYLEYGRLVTEKLPGEQELEWACDAVCEITDSDDPEEVLPFVVALLKRTPDELVNFVAAGPLEDLLCKHGVAVIDRILRQAERDTHLRYALLGVWGENRMDPGVAKRLKVARRSWTV